jgi:phosphoribosyl 1,2-cyclic phosphate phosphodiesterase
MTAPRLEITILGSGSSGGVPRADGNWGVCDPADPRNRRDRCSMMIRRPSEEGPERWTTAIIDASPEFRLQTAAAGAKRLDALLMTHDHADQSHGIDDIRAFAMRQRARVPCHLDAATEATMLRRFGYIFHGEKGYPAISDLVRIPEHGARWTVQGPSGAIPVVTFDQDHGEVRSVGYRFGGVAYSSDVLSLPDEAFEALRDLDLWIVDALRYTPHPTHAHVERTLGWIEQLKPRRAILTNLHIDLDYAELAARLPAGVEPAYDGMRIELEFDAENAS